MPRAKLVPLQTYEELPVEKMREAARAFLETMRRRRTVREFSDRPVPRDVIEDCLLAAGTAPKGGTRRGGGAGGGRDGEVKAGRRTGAGGEETASSTGKAPREWIDAWEPLGTDEHKPFLERAPWLIVIFAESYMVMADGTKAKNYYVTESVGIATGMLITALHHAGLVTLTHTPSPMKFLNDLLGRPANERPFLILVLGYPDAGATVPDITKKGMEDIAVFVE